jgi:hypothetical protein
LGGGKGEEELGRDGKERAYESDYLHEAPEGEEDCEHHDCGCEGGTAVDEIVVGSSAGSWELAILAHKAMGAIGAIERSESDARAEVSYF